MTSRARIALPILVAASIGCAPPVVLRDRPSACRIARAMLREPMTNAQLVEVATLFPEAERQARRAQQARIAGIVLTSLGAAGLIGGFVTGFATDTSQPAARAALYSVIGTTIGLGAGALLAGTIAVKARAKAYALLDEATRAECP